VGRGRFPDDLEKRGKKRREKSLVSHSLRSRRSAFSRRGRTKGENGVRERRRGSKSLALIEENSRPSNISFEGKESLRKTGGRNIFHAVRRG